MARLRKVFPSVEIPWETEKIVVGRVKFSGINIRFNYPKFYQNRDLLRDYFPLNLTQVGNVYQTSAKLKIYNNLPTNAVIGIVYIIPTVGYWDTPLNVDCIINIWHRTTLLKQIYKRYENVTGIDDRIENVFSVEGIPPNDYIEVECILQFPTNVKLTTGIVGVHVVLHQDGVFSYQYDSSKGKYFMDYVISVDYDPPRFKILDPEISDFVELPEKTDKIIWRTPDIYGLFEYVEIYYNGVLIDTLTKTPFPDSDIKPTNRTEKGTFVLRFYSDVKPVIYVNTEWYDPAYTWIEDRYRLIKLKANYYDITYRYRCKRGLTNDPVFIGVPICSDEITTGSITCSDQATIDPIGRFIYKGYDVIIDPSPVLISFYIKYRKMKDTEISTFCS